MGNNMGGDKKNPTKSKMKKIYKHGNKQRQSIQDLLTMLVKSGMKPLDTDPKSSNSHNTQPSQREVEDWATNTESIDLEAPVTVSGTA